MDLRVVVVGMEEAAEVGADADRVGVEAALEVVEDMNLPL